MNDVWYRDGLRFKCTGCGKCCSGSPGAVWVSEEEMLKLAAHLGMPLEEFKQKFTRVVFGRVSLKEVKTKEGEFDCVFLKGKQCSVYEVRPQQCQTYPWWKENLESSESWQETAKLCEGISEEAPIISLEEIQKALLKEKMDSSM